jgi:hypothetical protein
VPRGAQPMLRYNPRAHTKYDTRHALVMNLAGAYLALLARELKLEPAERAKKARRTRLTGH